MVNRWNYGYAHELTSIGTPRSTGPYAEQPHVKGRAPFSNVAIANADSGAFAYRTARSTRRTAPCTTCPRPRRGRGGTEERVAGLALQPSRGGCREA